jgi:D-alanyl-lipoteichoic acid acyltransferase DltB (MBOAT superfamily)
MSLVLFLNASSSSFIIFAADVIFNYLMVQLMLRTDGWKAKLIAGITIAIDIAILAYFKYLTFFVTKVAGFAVEIPPNWQESFPIPVFETIPPGVSFYTFEMIAFVIDSLNSRKKKPVGWLDYVNFMAFFPKIVAGPIERRLNLLPQLESFRFKFTVDNFVEGLRWMSLGFFMKFALAENIVP